RDKRQALTRARAGGAETLEVPRRVRADIVPLAWHTAHHIFCRAVRTAAAAGGIVKNYHRGFPVQHGLRSPRASHLFKWETHGCSLELHTDPHTVRSHLFHAAHARAKIHVFLAHRVPEIGPGKGGVWGQRQRGRVHLLPLLPGHLKDLQIIELSARVGPFQGLASQLRPDRACLTVCDKHLAAAPAMHEELALLTIDYRPEANAGIAALAVWNKDRLATDV